ITRVETLGQEEKAADAAPVLLELARMRKLIAVTFGVIGPDVLDLVALAAALSVLGVTRGRSGAGLYVVSHAGENPMDLTAVHPVQPEAAVACKGLGLRVEALA